MKKVDLFFSDKCNLKCGFCNSYFDGIKVDLDNVHNIVTDLYNEGVRYITWSGGDPFKYDINSILRYAKGLGIYNHVDSNGLGLIKYKPDFDSIDLLGLSVNWYTIDYIEKAFIKCNKKVKLKANTILTKKNIGQLPFYKGIIDRYCVDIWSIYQFWGLNIPEYIQDRYKISNEEYKEAISSINDSRIQARPVKERKDYRYITTSGKELKTDGKQYIKIVGKR